MIKHLMMMILVAGSYLASAQQWQQQVIGNSISIGYGSQSGTGLSVSGNGEYVAIGGPKASNSKGSVSVWKIENNNRTLVGSPLEGTAAGDLFGTSVSLNEDGSYLAVGMPGYDNSNGLVKVYKFENGSWVQVGNDITGPVGNNGYGAYFGKSVALTDDGQKVVAGAPSAKQTGYNNVSGAVLVFELNNNTWTKVGQNIEDSSYGPNLGNEVAVNSDASWLIGSMHQYSSSTRKGRIKIVRYDSNISGWRVNANLNGDNNTDQFGLHLDMSADGMVIAGGTSTFGEYAKAYQKTSAGWQQMGSTITTNGETSVALSADGMIMAVGKPSDGSGRRGQASIYQFKNGDWDPVAQINNQNNNSAMGKTVALSKDGLTLAVGDPSAFGLNGDIKIYRFCRPTNSIQTIESCENYTWIDGQTYTASTNTPTFTLVNAAGCDSVVTLNLTIKNNTSSTDVQEACDTYQWIDGQTYTSSTNTPTFTLTNAVGCDSIITLDLTIKNSSAYTYVHTACESYTWIDGQTYTSSTNTPTVTLTNAVGCDSIMTLDLTITRNNTSTDVQEACETYTWIDGQTYTSSTNTPSFTLVNTAGCDSIVTLNLTIKNNTSSTDVQEACDRYTWIDGQTYTASTNTPTFTLVNAAGCDSLVTLNLTIKNSSTYTDIQEACDSYIWIDGQTYTSSTNTPTFTLLNAAGCDSVIALDLTIKNSSAYTDVQTACESYTWIDGQTYTSSTNTPTITLSNAEGCDSIVTLDLTITRNNTGIDVQEACESYTWIDGQTYTSSTNTPQFTLVNTAGCDSVVSLDLTIKQNSTTTDIQTACGSYTWIDGQTYTQNNNTATFITFNAVGCDSIITLNLTLNNNASTDVKAVCGDFTWIDGQTYTSSTNTPTFTLTNSSGCDSIVTLDLTVNNPDITTVTADYNIAAEELNAVYQWLDCDDAYLAIAGKNNRDIDITANGTYAVEINKNGCKDTSDCIAITNVGLESHKLFDVLKIYPNPSIGVLNIDFGGLDNPSVYLYNVRGKLLLSQESIKSQFHRILFTAEPGIYFLEIVAKGQSKGYKIVKQ